MTAPARSEIAALVRQSPAGTLPPQAVAILEDRKILNRMSREIMNLSWGKQLDAVAAQSIAEYARRYGMDPARHLDLLGGKLYPNAQYYIEQGAQLMQAGVVSSVRQQHIEADARLAARYTNLRAWEAEAKKEGREADAADYARQAREARQEILERERLRIQFNVPEKAAAAVVTWITLAGQQEPVAGCNWAGGGVKQRDPVGDAEPSKTAESRSARRAWRQLVQICPALSDRVATVDEDGKHVTAVIAESRARFDQVEANAPRLTSTSEVGERLLQAGDTGYGDDMPLSAEAVRAMADSDPYALDDAEPAPRAAAPAIPPDAEQTTRPGETTAQPALALGDAPRKPRTRMEE
jgi:hypothetical protein